MFRVGILATLLATTLAHAEPDPAAKRHAAELATESQQHYKRGEFEIAAALLRQAYALYPQPNLQYNLGRALEGMGDARGAIDAYKLYLQTATQVDDRGAIERRIATLEATLADRERAAEPTPVAPAAPPPGPPAAIVTTAPAPPHEAGPSQLPWLAIGLGAATLGGGGAFGYLADHRHDQAGSATVGTTAQSYQDDAHRFATIANVMFVAGGLVLAGGIVWEIHAHGAHHDVALRASAGPGSVALELAW